MSLRTTLVLAATAVGAALALLLATDEWSVGRRDDGSPRFRYLLEDEFDRNVYQQRGRWLPSGRTPYLEEHSEYPQLATWMFALPYLFIDHHVERSPVPDNRRASQLLDRDAYFDAFHVMMAPVLLLLVVLTALNLRELGHRPAWALLLFLPGTLYFSFNRYDAVPAAAVALAILLQLRGRRTGAALALGAGAMLKWYPILLLPAFLAFNLHTSRCDARRASRPWRAGPELARQVLLPGAAAGALCLGILAITSAWDGGGLDAVLHPYRHHGARGPNPSSFLNVIVRHWGLLGPDALEPLGRLAAGLQFAPALLLALLPLRDRDALLRAALVVVLGFFAFSKIFSPQWVVWVTPLAVLLAPRLRAILVFAVALELLVYLQNPVLYWEGLRVGPGGFETSGAFLAACSARVVLLFAFWAWSLGGLLRTVLRTPSAAGAGDGGPAPGLAGRPAPAGRET